LNAVFCVDQMQRQAEVELHHRLLRSPAFRCCNPTFLFSKRRAAPGRLEPEPERGRLTQSGQGKFPKADIAVTLDMKHGAKDKKDRLDIALMKPQISFHFKSKGLLRRGLDSSAGLDGRLDLPVTYNCQYGFKKHWKFVFSRHDALNVAFLIEQNTYRDEVADGIPDSPLGHAWHRSAQQTYFLICKRT
jgi:hypothetical protein